MNIVSDSGFTPLASAAGYGYLKVVRALVTDPRTDIHLKDEFGRTALDLAVANEHEQVSFLLRKHHRLRE